MTPYLPFLVLIPAVLIQATVLPKLAILGVSPDLVMLIAVAWSLLHGTREGVVWGFVGGILLDVFSAAPFGVFTLSLLLVTFATGVGEINIYRGNLLPLTAGFVASLLYHLLGFVFLNTLGWDVAWRLVGRQLFLAALLNTALMPVVYVGAQKLQHMGERFEWSHN